jgi:ribose/xylose/arabinose/galactoside ABC-type transport system permease subunit
VTATAAPQVAAGASRLFLRTALSRYGVVLALLALLVAAAVWTPNFYLPGTLRNTLRQASIIGIVTLGQFLVLMVRGIDLSVPAVIGFTAVLLAERGPGLAAGAAWVLAIVVAVGCLNAYLVIKRQVPAFVATFGMYVLVEGIRLSYTKGSASGSVPDALETIGRATLLGVTWSVWVWLLLTAAVALFLYRTPAGRRTIMTGANPEMAALSGIRTGRIVVGAFIASAALAATSAVFLIGSSGYVDRFTGLGSDLDSITAALLGGARFAGGEGSLVGAAAGCLLLTSLLTVIVLLGWSPQLQLIAKGVVLLAALALQSSLRPTRA